MLKRRELLKLVGLGGLSTFIPKKVYSSPKDSVEPSCNPQDAPGYVHLTMEEAAFVTAWTDILIPRDSLSPSASECGVVHFIDRQLAGAFGHGAKAYMQGPWHRGTVSQGYQKPLSPREIYRIAIREINEHCQRRYKSAFDQISQKQQNKVVEQIGRGKLKLPSDLHSDFFRLIYKNSMEGFFSDPVYLGNKDKASWKMIGFPGVLALYSSAIKKFRGKKYKAPMIFSIEDMD